MSVLNIPDTMAGVLLTGHGGLEQLGGLQRGGRYLAAKVRF